MMDGVRDKAKELFTIGNVVRKDFTGHVYDYSDIVRNKRYYNERDAHRKVYQLFHQCDNTARRNNKGMIFHGSSPELYKEWLSDLIVSVKNRNNATSECVFYD